MAGTDTTRNQLPRVAVDDIEIDGVIGPSGTFVTLLSISANHDEVAPARRRHVRHHPDHTGRLGELTAAGPAVPAEMGLADRRVPVVADRWRGLPPPGARL